MCRGCGQDLEENVDHILTRDSACFEHAEACLHEEDERTAEHDIPKVDVGCKSCDRIFSSHVSSYVCICICRDQLLQTRLERGNVAGDLKV